MQGSADMLGVLACVCAVSSQNIFLPCFVFMRTTTADEGRSLLYTAPAFSSCRASSCATPRYLLCLAAELNYDRPAW